MDELRREYTLLFNGITETIEALEKAIKRLKYLQVSAEEEYICTYGAPPPAPTDGENVVVLESDSFQVME